MAAPALLARLYSEPWACTQEYLTALLRSVEQRLSVAGVLYPQLRPESDRELPDLERLGGTGVIPIVGPILKNPSPWELEDGACDIDHIRLLTTIAKADPTIERVVLAISSPGGGATGITEAAFELAELGKQKRLVAFTDSQACSAAYWLAAQASEIYVTPSSRVGSIGVYSLFYDESEWMTKAGLKVNALQVGKLKLAGAPFKPMSADERAYFQSFVDRIAEQFHAAVLSRRQIEASNFEGQVFMAEEAVQNNLADGVVNSLEELLSLLTSVDSPA